MLSGVLFALAAGLIWGTVFVTPLLLPQYPGTLLAFGRYLAFGLIALPLAWQARRPLRLLAREDWIEALKLSVIGNLLYYLCLAAAIQRAGAPLPTMIIGTLPVVIAIVSNASERTVPWSRLAPALLVLSAGILLVNQTELQRAMQLQGDPWRYAAGAGVAVLATACWTWYPVRNARWLRARPALAASTWATAQGLATLPLALIGMILAIVYYRLLVPNPLDLPLGPEPQRFILWMLALGLLASWLGTLLWNAAARRLPTSLSGQLIVCETLSALCYAWLLRRTLPDLVTLAGLGLLLLGVILGVRVFASPTTKALRRPTTGPASG